MVTQITDHEDQAEARLPEQFKGKERIVALVRSLVSEAQTVEDAEFPMLDLLNIDTQIGEQLDGIGDILTEPRAGQSDVNYRLALKAKAARITASGTPEQVIDRFLTLTGALRGVDYVEAFPAGYCIGATVPTLSDVQSGAPAGQVVTLVTGGLGTDDAYVDGFAVNVTRDEVRAIVSHTDGTATLSGSLASWLDTDTLFFYGNPVVGDILDAIVGASPVGVFVGLLDLFALEDDDLFLLEDGDTLYVTYDSGGR